MRERRTLSPPGLFCRPAPLSRWLCAVLSTERFFCSLLALKLRSEWRMQLFAPPVSDTDLQEGPRCAMGSDLFALSRVFLPERVVCGGTTAKFCSKPVNNPQTAPVASAASRRSFSGRCAHVSLSHRVCYGSSKSPRPAVNRTVLSLLLVSEQPLRSEQLFGGSSSQEAPEVGDGRRSVLTGFLFIYFLFFFVETEPKNDTCPNGSRNLTRKCLATKKDPTTKRPRMRTQHLVFFRTAFLLSDISGMSPC